jgi:hypothetical protein
MEREKNNFDFREVHTVFFSRKQKENSREKNIAINFLKKLTLLFAIPLKQRKAYIPYSHFGQRKAFPYPLITLWLVNAVERFSKPKYTGKISEQHFLTKCDKGI